MNVTVPALVPAPPRTPRQRILLALAATAALGLGQYLTASFSTPAEVSVWFPPAAFTFIYLAVDPRVSSALVVAAGRTLWAQLLANPSRPLWVVALIALVVAGTYLATVRVVLRILERRPPSARRPDVGDLAAFLGIGLIGGPLLVALTNRVVLALIGQTPWEGLLGVAASFFVGDAVAMATLVPLAWGVWVTVRTREEAGDVPLLVVWTLVAGALALLVLGLRIAGLTPLYLLLPVPLVLTLRYGIRGACLSVGTTGLMVTGALAAREEEWLAVSAAHLFILVLALIILSLGVMVHLREVLVRELGDSLHDREQALATVERQRVELAASEQRFRAMVREVRGYAIFLLDADARVASWNEGAERLSGYAAAEMLGSAAPFLELLDPDPDHHPLLEVARREGRAETSGWRRRRDGSRFWADVTVTALHDGQELIGFTAFIRDLTERRQAQEELERTARELELRNRDLQQFASVASHDLQEPLRMVVSFTELIEQDQGGRLTDDGRRHLAYVRDGSRRMQRMVADLARYARVGIREADLQPVPLSEIAADAVENLQHAIRTSGATVSVAEGLPVVHADRSQALQLFQNLIQNAVNHHPGAASVTIGGWVEDGRAEVHVVDDGPGIPERERNAIFEPFHRLDRRGASSEQRGTGIGLAICRRIVDRHGGRIWVAPTASGTDVAFTLPLAPQHPHVPVTSSRGKDLV